MNATVEMNGEAHALLACTVGELLRKVSVDYGKVWGVGFITVPLCLWPEADGSGEHEIHIWDPSLRATDMDDSGMVHDHPYDLRSVVLLGAIHDTEIVSLLPTDGDGDGTYQIHEVDPPPKPAVIATGRLRGTDYQIRDHGQPLRVRALPQRYRLATSDHTYQAGSTYRYARRRFHKSQVSGLTVTLCTRRGYLGGGGRLLARAGRTPEHVGDRWGAELFTTKRCLELLSQASQALLERARG